MHSLKINKQNRRCRRRRGFTLVEIVVVIALLAIIMAALIGNIGDIFSSAKEDIERQKINSTLTTALMRYNADIGNYPTNEEGINALLNAPAGKAAKWRGPYLKDEAAAKDSWDNPYRYVRSGPHNPRTYDLWSVGPNGTDENGAGDDITNWTKTTTTTPTN